MRVARDMRSLLSQVDGEIGQSRLYTKNIVSTPIVWVKAEYMA